MCSTTHLICAHQTLQDAPGTTNGVQRVSGEPQRRGRVIFAELKTRTGKLTPEQATWLSVLRQTGCVEVYEWRPADWEAICAIFRERTV